MGDLVVVGKDCREYARRTAALSKDREAFRRAWARTLDLLAATICSSTCFTWTWIRSSPISALRAELSELAKPPAAKRSLGEAMEEAGQFGQGFDRLAWNRAQLSSCAPCSRRCCPSSRLAIRAAVHLLPDFVP